MSELNRIGVAIEADLLSKFDEFIQDQGYANRSEAFRDLIRDKLAGAAVQAPDAAVVGTVTLIYDHHFRSLPAKLMDLQHGYHDVVVATTHAHLDHHTCLEVVILRGLSKRVRQLAGLLIGAKGVRHGRLVLSSPSAVLSQTA
jgi:CopG family transcriptional regulator, nickel-responsive regulator